MKKEEWLKLPYLTRLWRVLRCKHPWRKGTRIHQFTIADRKSKDGEFDYVVSVYECGNCCTHFLMEGLELNKRGKEAFNMAVYGNKKGKRK